MGWVITYNGCYFTDNAPVSASWAWVLNKDAATIFKSYNDALIRSYYLEVEDIECRNKLEIIKL